VNEAEALAEGATRLGIGLTCGQRAKLVDLAAMIRRWNRVMNLVSRHDVGRLLPRHLLDSLAFAPHLSGDVVGDLGSGAGLPGLPLAIAVPQARFCLIERSEKRCRFLRQAAIDLALSNVEVVTEDLTRFRPVAPFDTVVVRALAEPAAAWRMARPLLGARGRAVLACVESGKTPRDGDIVVSRHRVAVAGLEAHHRLLVIDIVGPEREKL